jgi:molybdate-binding protein/DNA-binding XRE family transcriptional regulator
MICATIANSRRPDRYDDLSVRSFSGSRKIVSAGETRKRVTEVQNNLGKLRLKRGIAASRLAAEIGIGRQTIYAIEAGSYVPNTTVSLRLARILGVAVEDIFQIAEQTSPRVMEAIFLGDLELALPRNPLRLCNVSGQVIAVTADSGNWGLAPTDAILLAPVPDRRRSVTVTVEGVGDSWKNPGRILIAGCDPSAPLLASAVEQQGCELVICYQNSTRSLSSLGEKLVHIAGTHLLNEVTGKTDLLPVTEIFPRNSVAVFSYAIWEEGLIVARGNPKKVSGVRDLVRKDIRIVNREPGSGSRQLLDKQLSKYRIARNKVRGYDQIALGHLPAVRQVYADEVDCCIGIEAGARALGLDFIALDRKTYHLIIRRKDLELPAVKTLLETLGRASFRREIEACTGYDMRTAGDRLV